MPIRALHSFNYSHADKLRQLSASPGASAPRSLRSGFPGRRSMAAFYSARDCYGILGVGRDVAPDALRTSLVRVRL